MKNIYYKILGLVALILATGCGDDDYTLKTGFDAPAELIAPINDEFININLESNAATVFEWTKANSHYGSPVLYEVVFDEVDGDYSTPIATMLSSAGGSNNYLSLTPRQLVDLAKLAGIGLDSQGEIKWKVLASQGGESKATAQEHILNLKRPAGISDIPADLYIYGEGFEAKSLETAMKFKKIDDGVFEIFASLSNGPIHLTNAITEGGVYYIPDANNKLTEAEQESSIQATATGNAYRIVVDFNLLAIKYTEIRSIKMVRTWEHNLGTLTYIGNHKFEVTNIALPFYHDWGYPEERYRFWVDTNNGREIWGSYHNDAMNGSNIPGLTAFNTPPNGSQPAEYYNVYNLADIPSPGQSADWIGMYKLPLGSEDKHANVVIDLSPSGNYKHTVTVY